MLKKPSILYEKATDMLRKVSAMPGFPPKYAESILREIFLSMQGALKTDLSLEIGAHEATYSIELKKRYAAAITVCALEASPRTFAHYSAKYDFKKLGIDYMNVLVSDVEDASLFFEYIDGGNGSLSSEISSIYSRKCSHEIV